MREDLELRRLRLKRLEARLNISPYESSDDFNDDWWEPGAVVIGGGGDDDRWQAIQNGVEVARVLAVSDGLPPDEKFGLPTRCESFVGIPFIEVAVSKRRSGVGLATLDLVKAHYRGRHLMAFSEDADAFWDSTGWSKYVYGDGTHGHQNLYIWWAH